MHYRIPLLVGAVILCATLGGAPVVGASPANETVEAVTGIDNGSMTESDSDDQFADSIGSAVADRDSQVENSDADATTSPGAGDLAVPVTDTSNREIAGRLTESSVGTWILTAVESPHTMRHSVVEGLRDSHTFVATQRDDETAGGSAAAAAGPSADSSNGLPFPLTPSISTSAGDSNDQAAGADPGLNDADPVDGPPHPDSAMGFGLLVVVVGVGGRMTMATTELAILHRLDTHLLARVRHLSARQVLEVLIRMVPGGVLAGYSRHDDSDPLENETRASIHQLVHESPGIYFAKVADEIGVAEETVRYHSRILTEEGLVDVTKLRGRRRLYPATTDGKTQRVAAALADAATADVVAAIERHEPTTLTDLAHELDCAPSTISYHLDRLEDDQLVHRERECDSVVVRLKSPVRSALDDGVSAD